MIHFILLISRQGKTRLAKWFEPYTLKERAKIVKEINHVVLSRPSKLSNFIEWKSHRVVYKRYASLFFVFCVDKDDNELIALEWIHHLVEVLDQYFGNVCELDLIFNFHKAYYIVDEMFLSGEIQEPSKKAVFRAVAAQDQLMESLVDQRTET